jgi:hypothetical protein
VEWFGNIQGHVPLPLCISTDSEASVAECHHQRVWHIAFHRELDPREQIDFANLIHEVEAVHLTMTPDVISWSLGPLGKFSVRSLYCKICMGILRKRFVDLWKIAVPLKVHVFL